MAEKYKFKVKLSKSEGDKITVDGITITKSWLSIKQKSKKLEELEKAGKIIIEQIKSNDSKDPETKAPQFTYTILDLRDSEKTEKAEDTIKIHKKLDGTFVVKNLQEKIKKKKESYFNSPLEKLYGRNTWSILLQEQRMINNLPPWSNFEAVHTLLNRHSEIERMHQQWSQIKPSIAEIMGHQSPIPQMLREYENPFKYLSPQMITILENQNKMFPWFEEIAHHSNHLIPVIDQYRHIANEFESNKGFYNNYMSRDIELTRIHELSERFKTLAEGPLTAIEFEEANSLYSLGEIINMLSAPLNEYVEEAKSILPDIKAMMGIDLLSGIGHASNDMIAELSKIQNQIDTSNNASIIETRNSITSVLERFNAGLSSIDSSLSAFSVLPYGLHEDELNELYELYEGLLEEEEDTDGTEKDIDYVKEPDDRKTERVSPQMAMLLKVVETSLEIVYELRSDFCDMKEEIVEFKEIGMKILKGQKNQLESSKQGKQAKAKKRRTGIQWLSSERKFEQLFIELGKKNFLSNKLSYLDFFDNGRIKGNGNPEEENQFKKIPWQSTERHIVYLFQELIRAEFVSSVKIYKKIEENFTNREGNDFKNKQLAVSFNNSDTSYGEIDEIISKIKASK
jgi:hypothetical protein